MVQRFPSTLRSTTNSVQHNSKMKLTISKEPKFETAKRAHCRRMKSSAEREEETMAKMPKIKTRPVNKIINSSYAPSAFMPRIKASRTVQIETLCDFTEADQLQKETDQSEVTIISNNTAESVDKTENEIGLCDRTQVDPSVADPKVEQKTDAKEKEYVKALSDPNVVSNEKVQSIEGIAATDVCTPVPTTNAKKPKPQSQVSLAKSSKPASVGRNTNANNISSTTKFAQGNQAMKRQKLEGGNARLNVEFQILNVKPRNLPHKSRVPKATPYPCTTDFPVISPKPEPKPCTKPEPFQLESLMRHEEEMQREMEERQRMEMEEVQKRIFRAQSVLTVDPIPLPEKERLPLTQVQSLNKKIIKSKGGLGIFGNLKKLLIAVPGEFHFPLDKRIPSLPTNVVDLFDKIFESKVGLGIFCNLKLQGGLGIFDNLKLQITVPEEFHFALDERIRPPPTNIVDLFHEIFGSKGGLGIFGNLKLQITVPEEFHFALDERIPPPPTNVVDFFHKIFEGKGGLGIFCNLKLQGGLGILGNLKLQITMPEEFHFALDERIPPPPTNVVDLFHKLSLNSEPHHSKDILRITNPNPFNLHTEGREIEKERRRAMETLPKQLEEERAKVSKATPYPYTTDFPVIPPKPEPKPCTNPEPFQFESLTRHEEEMQIEMEERQRMEMEEAQRRIFRAQPILKEDPIPLLEKERLPLTQVQEFEHHVEHRAVERADFDKKGRKLKKEKRQARRTLLKVMDEERVWKGEGLSCKKGWQKIKKFLFCN